METRHTELILAHCVRVRAIKDPVVQELLENMVEFVTTTAPGRRYTTVLAFPPTECLESKGTLKNRTGQEINLRDV